MTGTGQLNVRVDNSSWWLSQHLPYVVRDAGLAVVGRGVTGDQPLALPPGLYAVEAITPRGRSMSELVRVTPGQPAEVVVTEDSGTDDQPEPEPPAAAVELTGAEECTSTAEDGGWTFAPDGVPQEVPTAAFRIDGRDWVISLPLNPQARREEEATCRVEAHQDAAGTTRLGVRFATKRRVGRTVDGLLRHHEVMAGAGLLDEAAGLLLDKYQDPTAAALGGLTLHRFGRLWERQGWVENLARDFAWIPDGQILCAALLIRDHDLAERARGLDLLLAATTHRPLYTDGLSLASELLRRWPAAGQADDSQVDDVARTRAERLADLATYSCVADWDSVALSTGTVEQWS